MDLEGGSIGAPGSQHGGVESMNKLGIESSRSVSGAGSGDRKTESPADAPAPLTRDAAIEELNGLLLQDGGISEAAAAKYAKDIVDSLNGPALDLRWAADPLDFAMLDALPKAALDVLQRLARASGQDLGITQFMLRTKDPDHFLPRLAALPHLQSLTLQLPDSVNADLRLLAQCGFARLPDPQFLLPDKVARPFIIRYPTGMSVPREAGASGVRLPGAPVKAWVQRYDAEVPADVARPLEGLSDMGRPDDGQAIAGAWAAAFPAPASRGDARSQQGQSQALADGATSRKPDADDDKASQAGHDPSKKPRAGSAPGESSSSASSSNPAADEGAESKSGDGRLLPLPDVLMLEVLGYTAAEGAGLSALSHIMRGNSVRYVEGLARLDPKMARELATSRRPRETVEQLVREGKIAPQNLPRHHMDGDMAAIAIEAGRLSLARVERSFRTPAVYLASMNRCRTPAELLATISEMPSEKRFDHLVEEAANRLMAFGQEQLDRIPKAQLELLRPFAEGGGRIEETLCRVVNREDSVSLSYVPNALRTKKVCEAAVRDDGGNLQFVPKSVITRNLDLYELAIQTGSDAFSVLKMVPPFWRTDRLCRLAVQKDGLDLQWAPPGPGRRTADLCRLAILSNGEALKFVPLRTPDLCWLAILHDRNALEFVPEPLRTVALCLHACRRLLLLPWLETARSLLKLVPAQRLTLGFCSAGVREGWLPLDLVPVDHRTEPMCALAVLRGESPNHVPPEKRAAVDALVATALAEGAKQLAAERAAGKVQQDDKHPPAQSSSSSSSSPASASLDDSWQIRSFARDFLRKSSLLPADRLTREFCSVGVVEGWLPLKFVPVAYRSERLCALAILRGESQDHVPPEKQAAVNSLVATALTEGEAALAARGIRREDQRDLESFGEEVRYWARESFLGSAQPVPTQAEPPGARREDKSEDAVLDEERGAPKRRKIDSGAAPGAVDTKALEASLEGHYVVLRDAPEEVRQACVTQRLWAARSVVEQGQGWMLCHAKARIDELEGYRRTHQDLEAAGVPEATLRAWMNGGVTVYRIPEADLRAQGQADEPARAQAHSAAAQAARQP
jgi:hypothetical protein